MRHDAFSDHHRSAMFVASAWQALCGLTVRPLRTATHPWFWLARSASPETLPLLALVLLDSLSGLLGGTSTGACGHG